MVLSKRIMRQLPPGVETASDFGTFAVSFILASSLLSIGMSFAFQTNLYQMIQAAKNLQIIVHMLLI